MSRRIKGFSLHLSCVLLLAACDSGVHLLPENGGVVSAPLKSYEVQLQLAEHQRTVNFVPEVGSMGVQYTLRGADAAFFVADPNSGLLTVSVGLDHETPQDTNGDNIYELELQAWSNAGSVFESATRLQLGVTDISATVQAVLLQNSDRTLTVDWAGAAVDPDVLNYRLKENPDGVSGFAPLDVNADGIVDSADYFPLSSRQSTVLSSLLSKPFASRQFVIESLDVADHVLASSDPLGTTGLQPDDLVQYLKAADLRDGDQFGWTVALSADGSVLAVGVPNENGSGSGVNPIRDNAAPGAGAVYIYRREGVGWSAPVYIKASNVSAWDLFGRSVALSDDGNVLAVGNYREDGSGSGVNPAFDDALNNTGAAYVYRYSAGQWQEPAYINAPNPSADDRMGNSLALSGDGNTLIVSTVFEDGDGVGVNPAVNELTPDAGALYVYRYDGSAWHFSDYLKASNPSNWDNFGTGVAISSDGQVIAVGANKEDGSTGNSGAAYVFRLEGGTWQGPVYIKASNSDSGDQFGDSVSLNGDGSVLVVGAVLESGSGAGVDPAHDNDLAGAGAAYVYRYDGSNWAQSSYLKASNPGSGDEFGSSVQLNREGTLLLVGSPLEDGGSVGLNPVDDDGAVDAGAVYAYHYRAGNWSVPQYVKASNTAAGERFGWAVAMSADGNTVAIGAVNEKGAGTGMNPSEDKSAVGAGAVYLY